MQANPDRPNNRDMDPGLRAGAAVRDISPRRPMALYGYPHVERISTGVHDPLLATVIVLENAAGRKVVLTSLDLLMLEPAVARRLRRDTAAAAGCDDAAVFISCTHTHSGPVTSRLIGWKNDQTIPLADPAYLDYVHSQVVAAAAEAARTPAAVDVTWTHADATGVGGNRRVKGGLTDPECGILALRDRRTQSLCAMALIYGMHPTVLHEDSTLVSADFPYYTRCHIQEHAGQAIPIVYHNAPSGNQSPRHFVQAQTFDEAERLGRRLGQVVCEALDAIAPDAWQADADLGGRLTAVALPRNPVRPLPVAEQLLADYRSRYRQLQRDHAPRAEVRTAECAVFGAEGTVALAQALASGELDRVLKDYERVDVQVVRLGKVSLMGFPGETFTEYALDLKRRAPGRTFAVCLVNGNLQGYIVTPAAVAEGGYEATNAVFAPDSGPIMVDAALGLLSELNN